MKKKEKKEEAKVILVNEPAKIMKVIFRVPTSVPYESVEVEVSGLASLEEVKGKYNDIVESFRPAPKPKPEPMRPYTVQRTAPVEDGDRVEEGQILTNAEIAEVQKGQIKQLMSGLGYKNPMTSDVFKLTGLSPKESKNLPLIIEKLKELPAQGN